jgi:HEAT repeat protein
MICNVMRRITVHQEKDGINCYSVEQLVTMLSAPDHFDRAKAARLLCNRGKEAIRALPALLAMHSDPWYQVRIQVPRAIIHMGAGSAEAVEVLNKLLEDEDESVRLFAREALRVLLERVP